MSTRSATADGSAPCSAERSTELSREDPAGCGELVVTQDLAGDRLSLDVAEDQVGGAEIGRPSRRRRPRPREPPPPPRPAARPPRSPCRAPHQGAGAAAPSARGGPSGPTATKDHVSRDAPPDSAPGHRPRGADQGARRSASSAPSINRRRGWRDTGSPRHLRPDGSRSAGGACTGVPGVPDVADHIAGVDRAAFS